MLLIYRLQFSWLHTNIYQYLAISFRPSVQRSWRDCCNLAFNLPKVQSTAFEEQTVSQICHWGREAIASDSLEWEQWLMRSLGVKALNRDLAEWFCSRQFLSGIIVLLNKGVLHTNINSNYWLIVIEINPEDIPWFNIPPWEKTSKSWLPFQLGQLVNWADGWGDRISPARQIPSNIVGGGSKHQLNKSAKWKTIWTSRALSISIKIEKH